jgi:hypothetical protein
MEGSRGVARTATAYERKIAERFARFLGERDGVKYDVIEGNNPPDFLLSVNGAIKTWLELSDVFLNNEEGKFLNQPEEKRFTFSGAVDELAQRVLERLDHKLGKPSYQDGASQFGQGILLLICQHVTFGEVDLAQIQRELGTYAPRKDHGLFEVAYFEYQLTGEPRNYMVVYPVPLRAKV